MSATPKSMRQPPARNFEDYSLTYETSHELGLFPIPNEMMEYVNDLPGESGYGGQAYSPDIEIGFNFQIGSVQYDKVCIGSSGWVILQESGEIFDISDCFATFLPPLKIEPKSIDIDKHALIAAWFNNLTYIAPKWVSILHNNYRSADDMLSGGVINSDEHAEIVIGKIKIDENRQRWLDSTAGGVKIHRGTSTKGRYFLIRWNSISRGAVGLLSFDTVIYENGTIELRYAPAKISLSDSKYGAAVGIWIPQSNINYRDFSIYLKNDETLTPNTQRGTYKFGGAVYNGTYVDSSSGKPFSVSENHVDHWPAKGNNGAVFRFSPPINKRRNNRRTTAVRDSKPISPGGSFDDRKTTYFVADTVSYPAGLPVNRPYTTSYKGVHSTLDLFSLGDVEVVRTGSMGMYDQLLEETPHELPEDGFREVKLHEQGRFEESFYATGSSIYFGEEPGTFASSLKMKETIRLSFPVKLNTSMPGTTSSIYYYNREMSRWNVPTGAIGDLIPQFDAFSFDTRWSPGYGTTEQKYTPGSMVAEDARGFDPYGRPLASGSLQIYRNVSTASYPATFNQTIPAIGKVFSDNQKNLESASERQPKSVPQNSDYAPSDGEIFEIPITQPFLLEKAAFEIPLAAGSGWFDDVTTTSAMFVSGVYSDGTTELNRQLFLAFDRGGPALTLSLFCLKSGRRGQLDLVMSGTITHADDTRSIDVCAVDDLQYSPIPTIFFNQTGITNPTTTIQRGAGDTFTGSVLVESTAAVSNGTSTCLWKPLFITQTAPIPPTTMVWNSNTLITWASNVMKEPNYSVNSSSVGPELLITLGVNPLGRAQQGFTPGGGSAFGGDNTTYGRRISRNCSIDNPYYLDTTAKRNNVINDLNAAMGTLFAAHPGGTLSFVATGDIDTHSHRRSPYLLNPGDKLVLAISKTRPVTNFVRGSVTGSTNADIGLGRAEKILKFDPNCTLTEVIPHDVTLITGSINISMYGSYVSDGSMRAT